ncbi:MAG: hypothetical protein K9G57_02615 [Ignavibacteriales bacterium]|nr:hypothetical protein [Ignavibacteriales bacterium]MCF8435712.1 hypothetical protein [Ignavibacteriales bacterium]
MRVSKQITIIFLVIFAFGFQGQDDDRLKKVTDDDNTKYTNVGNLGLTVTNFGVYGHSFRKWPTQSNCEYPLGSGIEHLYNGGLWVGAFRSDNAAGANRVGPYVTTSSTDPTATENGYEFTNRKGSYVQVRSSLIDSPFFSPDAISHQDFIAEYADTNRYTENNEVIIGHNPMGIAVRQESYAWNYPFADFFVIMNYWIKNVSNKYLDSVYIGLWTDTVVRNTNKTSPYTGTSFFNKGGNGYSDSLQMAYEFDAAGDLGFTDSYIGIQFLGSSEEADSVNFVSWQYRNTTNANLFTPQTDPERYRKLMGYFGGSNRYNSGIDPNGLKTASNRSMLISSGYYKSIAPGDSINVTFAIVCAKKYGSESPALDTEEQRKNLYTNAGWAIRAYNGEDRNGNGILDPGEDLDVDGIITRYILPAPPSSPGIKAVPGDRNVTVYWDRRAEESIDPISGRKDFEGYRLYRTNTGYDLTSSQNILKSLVKMAEFDSLGNNVGFNTGFGYVELIEPKTFPNDAAEYYYKYEVPDLLNGWQYIFSISAFDEGDPVNGLTSLESSLLASSAKVIPGSLPTSSADVKIGVYPNPYYGEAIWDGGSERLRKLYFFNLPEECEITIYTLAGDIVDRLHHDQNSNGSDVRWFETFSKDQTQKMSGGEHAWDLITGNDQAVATGLYLFSVKDSQTGEIKTGKFLVIK